MINAETINKYIPDNLKKLLSPITVRFLSTEDIIETMEFVDMFNRDELDSSILETIDRTNIIMGKELLRRKVIFWDSISTAPIQM